MTIKIEQEAVLRVLDSARSQPSCYPQHPLKPPSGILRPDDASSSLPAPYGSVGLKVAEDDFCPDLQSLDSDDDCISLSSCSSASSFSEGTTERRVSFAAPLVTEVKTRPRTKECDKKLLFYTQSETDR